MARMRMVKPEMRKSLTVSSWPVPVRWTFVGLLGYCDDEGRGHDEIRLLKAELYPLDDDVSTKKIDQHLEMMVNHGPVCRYVVDGKRYLHITTWAEHQKVSHATTSKIPPCPVHEKESSGVIPESLPNGSGGNPAGSGTAPSRAGAGARGSGNREQGTGIAPDGAQQEPLRNGRPRDAVWDAVADVCGVDPSILTESARGAMAKAVRELKAVDATPSQVVLRARRFREEYRNASLTPSALAKHWPALAGPTTDDDEMAWAR